MIVASEHNTNFDTIYNDYNGNITNANISASAAIVDTKLASISTAGKVNISALTVASQATGDIIYASSASAWARLPIGTSSQVLTGGTTPAFAAVPMPAGSLVQMVSTQTGAVATGSTQIPSDDTIPQNTEGDEYMTRSITPTSSSNFLIIDVVANVSTSNTATYTAALFQDTTANALAAAQDQLYSSSPLVTQHIAFRHKMTAGTTSSTTFKVRIGLSGAGTITFNGIGAARFMGGVMASSITIYEVKA